MLGSSQLHSSERASRPAARTAHRAQQPGEIRWDGSKKAELAGGLVLVWCWPGIIIHNHISWRLSIGRARPGGHMRGGGWVWVHSDNHSCSCDRFHIQPSSKVDDKMLEAMLAMFVLAQRPSVKYGKKLSSNHDALN